MSRTALFRLLALGTSSLAVFLVLELALRALPVADATLTLPIDEANPVARLTPDRDLVFSQGWNFAIVTRKHTNNYGFLSDQDYHRDGMRPLVAVVGDSYVEAMQVPNARSFPGLLSSAVAKRGRVYAFGLSGAALPTYLAYAEFASAHFAPDAMVFCIIGNDFDESFSRYGYSPRNYYFVDGPDGALTLQRPHYAPSGFKRLARRSALARYLFINGRLTPEGIAAVLRVRLGDTRFVANTAADLAPQRLLDSRRAIDAFFRLLPDATRLPPERIAFILDGLRPQLYDPAELSRARASYAAVMREYFMAAARGGGYDVIDLGPVFQAMHARDGSRFEFPADNHWNALGHRVAARELCLSRFFGRLFGEVSCGELDAVASAPRAAS